MIRRDSQLANVAILVRDLCQLRRGPEDLPYSTTLLGVLIAASVLLDVVSGGFLDETSNLLPRSLVSTGLVLALCWIALTVRHFGNRYVQTAGALIACNIVFSLLILPFAWLAGPTQAAPVQLTPMQTLVGWIILAIVAWNLAVNAHILRRALEVPFALALAIALAWLIADWALGQALFGTPA